jgi:hypothetical protein
MIRIWLLGGGGVRYSILSAGRRAWNQTIEIPGRYCMSCRSTFNSTGVRSVPPRGTDGALSLLRWI